MVIHQLPLDSIAIVGWQTKWIWSLPLDDDQTILFKIIFGHFYQIKIEKGGI
jgi:hypothetical protein